MEAWGSERRNGEPARIAEWRSLREDTTLANSSPPLTSSDWDMDTQIFREMRVEGIVDVAAGIREISIAPLDGEPLDSFSAGAHIECEVTLADGKQGLRAYSLVNAPGDAACYRIAVALSADSRGGSIFMHSLKLGEAIRVGRARNDFPLQLSVSESLLIAGGIGVTPILSMARTLGHTGRPFRMHYAGRDRSVMAYVDEAEARGCDDHACSPE